MNCESFSVSCCAIIVGNWTPRVNYLAMGWYIRNQDVLFVLLGQEVDRIYILKCLFYNKTEKRACTSFITFYLALLYTKNQLETRLFEDLSFFYLNLCNQLNKFIFPIKYSKTVTFYQMHK